jgi:hypothetical protein
MAEKFDVASRLAEGRPAVDNIQTYVWACHVLGYANPDLTQHASQVSDWYGSEDGLDLRALDADCAALEAAVAATEDALTRQDDQLGELSAAWQGRSADLSREFLHRHGEASAAAAAAVRTTADALAKLRDNLWHTVDGKVAAAITTEGRAPDEWLAAAQTVTTGAGDRAAASELIDQEVKPFVDNDIRADWLAAMRSAMAAVAELYDAATAELTAEPDAVFDVPGEIGPSWTPPIDDNEVTTVPAAASSVSPPVAAPPPCRGRASAAPSPAPAPSAPMAPPRAACRRGVQPRHAWRHRRRHRARRTAGGRRRLPGLGGSSPMRSARTLCSRSPTRPWWPQPLGIDEPPRTSTMWRLTLDDAEPDDETAVSRAGPPGNPSSRPADTCEPAHRPAQSTRRCPPEVPARHPSRCAPPPEPTPRRPAPRPPPPGDRGRRATWSGRVTE